MASEERRLRRLERRKERLETEKNVRQKTVGKIKATKIAYVFFGILVVAGSVYGLSMLLSGGSKYDPLAKCLTEKGATMYGAYWCPNCQNQKTMFGNAFQHISYVECDPRGQNAKPDLCVSEGVTGYPTWKIGNQTLSGVQKPEALAAAAGCVIEPGK